MLANNRTVGTRDMKYIAGFFILYLAVYLQLDSSGCQAVIGSQSLLFEIIMSI